MTVRPAAKEDIPAIAAMEAATFPSGASESFLASLTGGAGAVLAAAEGGALLGYAWYQLVLDEGYVGNVAVAESCRRQGVGTALVRAMLADAGERGAAFLTLEVRESNLAARRLYERCGFETVGVRRNYYERPREDAVLMTAFFGDEE